MTPSAIRKLRNDLRTARRLEEDWRSSSLAYAEAYRLLQLENEKLKEIITEKNFSKQFTKLGYKL